MKEIPLGLFLSFYLRVSFIKYVAGISSVPMETTELISPRSMVTSSMSRLERDDSRLIGFKTNSSSPFLNVPLWNGVGGRGVEFSFEEI